MQELWIIVISRMAHLICYEIIMGPIRFFLPGAHGMLKPSLDILYLGYTVFTSYRFRITTIYSPYNIYYISCYL